jgi:hypothetical protein
MLHSKTLKKILLVFLKNNLHEPQNEQFYEKLPKDKKLPFLKHIGIISKILIHLLLKINGNNIYWC